MWLLFYLTFLETSNAQKNTFKLDLWGPFNSVVLGNVTPMSVAYEREIRNWLSLNLNFEIGGYKKVVGSANSTSAYSYTISGRGVVFDVHYFPVQNSASQADGYYLAPYFKTLLLKEAYIYDHHTITTKGWNWGLGLSTGYKWILQKDVSVDILAGYGWSQGQWNTPNKRDEIIDFVKSDPDNFCKFSFGVYARLAVLVLIFAF